jgi:HEAT repeat protein
MDPFEINSCAFERFRWSFFEDEGSARDGLDTTALLQLEGEERGRAEDMLIGYLPDARAIIGLGELRSRRAAPRLRRLFNAERQTQRAAEHHCDGSWSPFRMVHLAKALWQIQPEARWLAAVTEILACADLDEIQRLDAAMALAVFRDPAAVRALVKALDDRDSLVSHHAAQALLTIHGLIDEAGVSQRGPEHMIYRVMSDDLVRREGGKHDVLAAITARPISQS